MAVAKVKQVGFKMFLNITPTVTNWTSDGKSFHLVFEENPLADFVELPDDGRAQDELWDSNILCGVIRGSLEMVSARICTFDKCDVDVVWLYRCRCKLKQNSSVMCCAGTTRLRCGSRLYGI